MSMKKGFFSVIMVSVLVWVTMNPEQCCLAEEKTLYYQIGDFQKVKSFNEIEKLVEANSPELKKIRLQYEAKEYEYEQAKILVDDYQDVYTDSMESEYRVQESAREQYLSALLEREVCLYYKTNKIGLIQYETLKVRRKLLELCYQILIKQKQQEYQKANIEYLDICKSITQTRCKHGKTTAQEVDKVSVQLEEAKALYEEARNDQEKLLSTLETQIGYAPDFSITLPVDDSKKEYVVDEVVSILQKNEYSYEEAIANKDAYTVCNTCEKAVMGSLVYKKNEAMMSMYSLEAERIANHIDSYGKWKIAHYKIDCKKTTVAKKKLTIRKTEYRNVQQKYRKGKAAKVAVYEAKTKWLEEEVNYCLALCEKMLCEYEIDCGIYEG